MRIVVIGLACLATAGCPPGSPGADGGSGPDATVDAGADAALELADGSLDAAAPPDASQDAGVDAATDAGGEVDGGPIVPPDCEQGDDRAIPADPAGEVVGAAAAQRAGGFVVAFSVADGVDTFLRARLLDECGVPSGDEILVDGSGLVVGAPVAAALGEMGGFILAWSHEGGPGDDEGAAVVFQLFESDGSPARGLELANETTFDDQLITSAASFPGGFALAWEDYSGSVLVRPDAVLSTFDETGQAVSGDVLISPLDAGAQNLPLLATAGEGTLLGVWAEDGAATFRRRGEAGWLDAEGITPTDQPALASGAAGAEDGFAVAMTSDATDLEGDVFLALVPSEGAKLLETTIAERPGAERDPLVAAWLDRFFVAWSDETYRDDPEATDPSGSTVMAAWIDDDGNVGAEPFVVPTTTDFDQELAAVAAGPGGDLVVWVDWSRAEGDDDGGLRGRLITLGEVH